MGGPGSGRKPGSGSSNKKWTSKGITKKERAEGVIAKKGAAKRYSDEAINKNAMAFADKARKWRKNQKG